MRLTKVKHDYHGEFAVTGEEYEDLYRAVRTEHFCEDSSCDIREANENGYPRIAALLLTGATEAYPVGYLLRFYRTPGDMYSLPEWNSWAEHFDTYAIPCEACGAYTFSDDYWTPEQCGNCLATLDPRGA